MADLKAIDRAYAQKYLGRWIISADVILDEVLDKDVTLIQEDFTDTNDPGMKLVIFPFNGRIDPIKLAAPMGATPVYMNLGSAIGLVVKLKKEIRNSGALEKLAEPMLYDTVEKESLVAVYLEKPACEEEYTEIKQVLNEIAEQYGARILSFDLPRNNKFCSTDFREGLRLKCRTK